MGLGELAIEEVGVAKAEHLGNLCLAYIGFAQQYAWALLCNLPEKSREMALRKPGQLRHFIYGPRL